MKIDISHKYEVVDGKNINAKSIQEISMQSDKMILYFYPKDNTPGCTMESKDFTCLLPEFKKLGIQIVGISKDDVESHKKFIESQGLDLELISDSEGKLHDEFGVIGEKNMYGKITVGVIRSTFLLDSEGNVLKEWRNVKATGHAEKVLREVQKT